MQKGSLKDSLIIKFGRGKGVFMIEKEILEKAVEKIQELSGEAPIEIISVIIGRAQSELPEGNAKSF